MIGVDTFVAVAVAVVSVEYTFTLISWCKTCVEVSMATRKRLHIVSVEHMG